MADFYTRDCRHCGDSIRMARMASGCWLPFELDGSGKHDCCSRERRRATFVRAVLPARRGPCAASPRVEGNRRELRAGSVMWPWWAAMLVLILLILTYR